MIVTLPADAVGQLAALALAEAERHEPRTPGRRAAAALYYALDGSKSVDAARRALAGFAAPETEADALDLLGRLAATADRSPGRQAG